MTDTFSLSAVPPPKLSQPGRFVTGLLSFVLHPLFIPLYVAWFLLFIHPFVFPGYEDPAKLRLLATVFVNLTLLPAVTVLLCRGLKFIDSIYLRTMRERIIPLAAAMIFYFWCWYVLKDFVTIPLIFRQFLLGCFITIIIAWLANIYFLISLHALAAGGLFCFISLVVFRFEGGSALYLAVAALISGIICSVRLAARAHRPFEVYTGFMGGVAAQLLAVMFS